MAQMVIYISGLAGCLFSSIILSCCSQRQAIIATLVANIAGLTITLFAASLPVAVVGLSINFIGASIQNGVIISFLSDSVGEAIRVRYTLMIEISFSVSVVLVSLAYWLINPWEYAMGFYQLLPSAISLAGFIFLSEDTPFELVTRNTPEEALLGFQRIAALNKNECSLDLQQVAAVSEEFTTQQR